MFDERAKIFFERRREDQREPLMLFHFFLKVRFILLLHEPHLIDYQFISSVFVCMLLSKISTLHNVHVNDAYTYVNLTEERKRSRKRENE